MGELSNVNSANITASAGKMEAEISNVQSGITMFRDAISKLNNTWTGESKNVFMQSFETDSEAMNEMVAQMSEVCESLKHMAQTYDESESNISSRLQSLR